MQVVSEDGPHAQVCSWLHVYVFGETCTRQIIVVAPHHAVIEVIDTLLWHFLCATFVLFFWNADWFKVLEHCNQHKFTVHHDNHS